MVSMVLYESTFIVRQDIPAQDVHKKIDYFAKLVEETGGEVVKREYWGLRSLSYVINKNKKGHYVMLGIKSGSGSIAELERKLKINEDVLRYLTVKVESISQEPSPMMRISADKD